MFFAIHFNSPVLASAGIIAISEIGSTSRSLLVRAQSLDKDAWYRLVELYAPLVMFWCRRQNVADEDCADIFQEVFRSLAANISRFHKRKDGGTFRAWLRIITRNKVLDHFRNQRNAPRAAGGTEAYSALMRIPHDDVHIESEIEDMTEEDATASLVHRALAQIKPCFQEQTWRAFWRFAVDDVSAKDVADELSMSPGAVRVAKSRVLQRLRSELSDLID